MYYVIEVYCCDSMDSEVISYKDNFKKFSGLLTHAAKADSVEDVPTSFYFELVAN